MVYLKILSKNSREDTKGNHENTRSVYTETRIKFTMVTFRT